MLIIIIFLSSTIGIDISCSDTISIDAQYVLPISNVDIAP